MLQGQCHCGAVQFRIHGHDKPLNAMRCDCSLCRRKGAIMGTARLEEFELTAGEDSLTLYQWNTRVARHYFCSVCGIYTHHQRRRRPDEYGYNIACLTNYDINELGEVPVTDGASLSVTVGTEEHGKGKG